MEIIAEREHEKFVLYKNFKSNLFLPIGQYVNWKLQAQWDDYNELYHAINFIENLKKNNKLWYEIHTIEKNGVAVGVVTIVGGKVKEVESDLKSPENETILLKYFHIVEKGKGYGSYWLNAVLIPFYAKKGFKYVYVTSSHPKSFGFYNKIGTAIRTYEKESDTKQQKRLCKSFLITMADNISN